MGMHDRIKMVWRNKLLPMTTVRESHLTCSQYAEDMIFQRLLLPGTSGTYVDVGAHHPIKGSNTYRLYAHGWDGLTVDPNPAFAPLFRARRPRDIHIVEGVASKAGDLSYFQFSNDVMNTFSAERAKTLVADGHRLVKETVVPCRPLAEMVDEHLRGRPIDLLSVDCEGLDLDALKSLDLSTRRPTAIMIEDYGWLKHTQKLGAEGPLQGYLTGAGYTVIAQSGWTTILIANDWADLFERSPAYSAGRVQNGYLPGQ